MKKVTQFFASIFKSSKTVGAVNEKAEKVNERPKRTLKLLERKYVGGFTEYEVRASDGARKFFMDKIEAEASFLKNAIHFNGYPLLEEKEIESIQIEFYEDVNANYFSTQKPIA